MAGDDDRVIAVTGATGRQGGAVTRHLLTAGWRVRALTRTPDREPARRLAALGAEVQRADMADPATLREAFDGTYGVYSVQNPMISGLDGEVAQGRNVADAAKECGVRHLVYGSAGSGERTGVGSWDSKVAVETHMRALGLPITVLRPQAFMELMTDKGYFPPAAVWHLMPKLMGEHRPVTWLCVDDLGAIAARVFGDPERFIGADLRLTADVKTIAECRKIWREVTERPPRRFPMPQWMFKVFVGDDLLTMWTWLRTQDVPVDPADTHKILPSAMTVREWLRRQRD